MLSFDIKYDVHLSFLGFETELVKEMKRKGFDPLFEQGRFFIFPHLPDSTPIWSQSIWRDVQRISISSIGDGVKKLKAINRNWALWTLQDHRRAQLIQDQLPYYASKPLPFLGTLPSTPMGGWTLWDAQTILCSAQTKSPFPLGFFTFEEDKINPPSRAYLKLWEFFTLTKRFPSPEEQCLDMGACPGGWTWVLHQLKCPVISVDKSPLDERLQNQAGITFRQESAFGLDPKKVGKVDWFFSDIICYPDKLLELVQRWLEGDYARHFVCTIKYQSETDWETTEKFLQIPGSQIHHLVHNKHEVTWSLIR